MGAGPLAPIGVPIVVDEQGWAWLPSRDGTEVHGWHLHTGLGLGWAPLPGNAGVVLHVLGGAEAPGSDREEDGTTVTLTRAGLRALIADLLSIDEQLGGGAA